MKSIASLLLVSLVGAATCSQTFRHPGVPEDWSVVGKSLPQKNITLTFAVKQNTEGKRKLETELLNRSDPDNTAFYGKWFSKAKVDSLLAKPEATAAVKAWLATFVPEDDMKTTSAGDWVSVTTTVKTAEKMLKAEFHQFRYKNGKTNIHRLRTPFQLPNGVADHIDFVGPTVRFPVVQSIRKVKGGSNSANTPPVLKKLYNVQSAKGSAGTSANIQACASFLGQFYEPDDLSNFISKYSADASVTTPKVYGPDGTQAGIEASLDIEYIMGLGEDVPTQFWSTAGQQPHNPENEPFLIWLQNVANVTEANKPLAMSVSYGDNENGVDFDYATRVNVEFQKAGVRGTSVLFSSGDGGVSGGQSQPCRTFVPTFPAGSPWVTAVGGTEGSNPERCASFSSGGFSNYWGRPSYQDEAVSSYMKTAKNLPEQSRFNASGNGFPDVAAQGVNFAVRAGGFWQQGVAGTSCSSPTFTGILSLVNEERLKAGKSSLGYLNPMIYKTLGPNGVFNDITDGSNPGCGTEGFYAGPGWDPVTGWGTPDFQKMKSAVLSLP
jgi:tripeptidyl-peptidase-1